MPSPHQRKISLIFKKFFTRSMPLLSAQYWHQGERYGLPQITNNSVYFNPLFAYKKDKATDVYYDINNPETDDKLLIVYFLLRPKEFGILADKYEKECQKLLKLSKLKESKDFSKIFNLRVLTWPKLCIMNILGELVKKNRLNQITKRAYNLRRKTEKVEYLSGNTLIKLADRLLPDFKNFTDVLTFEEIINKNIPSKRELVKRKIGYIYFEGKIYANLSIKQLEKLKNIKILRPDINSKELNSISLFKGTPAMRGKIRGKVKVVFETKQLDKIKKGDILVTPMTTPDYIMAMQRTRAFITDEGGITCHAAIVAREMKKPCIIGTKIATKVLRDGDWVEVDANNGIVKILKRAK